MLFVCLCVRFGGVHYAIAMVRWSVERVELHRASQAIDDVVASTGGYQDREPGLDAMLDAIKHRLAFAFLYPEDLIEFVNFSTDIFTGLEAHHDELAIPRRVQDRAERRVQLRYLFDVVDKPFMAFHALLATP